MRLPFGIHAAAIAFAVFMAAAGPLHCDSVPNRAAEPAALQLLQVNRPLVIGHRGYSVAAPENTLPSFELALLAGADLVELDYHHSRDGALVVVHDPMLDRTTDSVALWGERGGKVADKTVAELKTLDAGKWFNPRFAGTRLPLLTEALDLIQKSAVTLIERKDGDAPTCVRFLRERELINRVVVQSYDWSFLRELHDLAPEQVLGALGPHDYREGRKLSEEEKILNNSHLDELVAVGARVAVWNRQITRESVQLAHRRGLKVWVYTVNETAVAQELVALGVDGIITNNPGVIWKALALRPPG